MLPRDMDKAFCIHRFVDYVWCIARAGWDGWRWSLGKDTNRQLPMNNIRIVELELYFSVWICP